MNQMNLFDLAPDAERTQAGDKIGLLHRVHLYEGDALKYTAFPSLKGMKLIGIRMADVFNLTVDEYQKFLWDENLMEVNP